MNNRITPTLKLGIIAGGQLARMLIQEAIKLDISTYVMDNDEDCPAKSIAGHFVLGSNTEYDSVYRFGKMVNILTYEMENINIEALQRLKAEGLRIVPDPDALELIQDKGLQKDFYTQNGIPTSAYRLFGGRQDILRGIETGEIRFPFVQKIRKGGYDGRGVAVFDDSNDLDKILEGPSIIEEKINIQKEIAVIAARNSNGEIKCFPVVEMVFDTYANLVDKLICPASISANQSEQAVKMASDIITLLDMEGLLAVEFFIDHQGAVMVNEMAPRPHNSGHHSIDSVVTSQFEQHLRAILNLPLGSTRLKSPAVMVNLLGAADCEGPARYEGVAECMAIEGVKIHLYGKKITKPFRKMGHITVLSDTVNEALKKAEIVQQSIRVRA